jgi:hypothetical protein
VSPRSRRWARTVLSSELVAFAKERVYTTSTIKTGTMFGAGRPAIVSCLRSKDMVIVREGTVWELAATD